MSVTAPELDVLIDDFNRANGRLSAGAGAAIWVEEGTLNVTNNTLGAGTAWAAAYTLAEIEGANCDHLIECTTLPASGGSLSMYTLSTNIGTPQWTAWQFSIERASIGLQYIQGPWEGGLWQWIGGANHTLAVGDQFWLRKRGSNFRGYKRASGASSWTELFNLNSTLYAPASGRLYLELSDTTSRWDNVRAGPLVGTGPGDGDGGGGEGAPAIVGRAGSGNGATTVTFANMAAPAPISQEPVVGTYTPQVGDLLVVAAWAASNTAPSPPASAPAGLSAYQTKASRGANNVGICVATTRVTGTPGANIGTWTGTPANIDVIAIRGQDVDIGEVDGLGGAAATSATFPALTLSKRDGSSLALRFLARAGGTIFSTTPLPDLATPQGAWQLTTTQRSPWGTGQQRLSSWARSGWTTNVDEFTLTGLTSQPYQAVTLEVTGVAVEPPPRPVYGFRRYMVNNGPEHGAITDVTVASGPFNNVLDSGYTYDTRARALDYLKSRGIRHIWVVTRWERLQPVWNGALEQVEVNRLLGYLNECQAAGLEVCVDVHGFGLYYTGAGTANASAANGTRTALTEAAFRNFWQRLAAVVVPHPAVVAVSPKCEPQATGGLTRAVWRAASLAAIQEIRAVDPNIPIYVCGWNWASLGEWANTEGATGGWLPVATDPNVFYEAHHYWDGEEGGLYGAASGQQTYEFYRALAASSAGGSWGAGSYADALQNRVMTELNNWVTWLANNNAAGKGIVGEIGWPAQGSTSYNGGSTNQQSANQWNALADLYLTRLKNLGMSSGYWSCGAMNGDASQNWQTIIPYHNPSGWNGASGTWLAPLTTPRSQASVIEAHPSQVLTAPTWEGLIDDFNRPDGSVDAGAGQTMWRANWFTNAPAEGATDVRVIGNTLGRTGTAYWGRQAYVLASHRELQGANCDVVFDLVTPPSGTNYGDTYVHFLLTNLASNAWRGLALYMRAAGQQWTLRRKNAGTDDFTTLATADVTAAAGDTYWIAKRGTAVTVYRRPSGGVYAQILHVADCGYSPESGVVGVEFSDVTARLDNLRGGPFVGVVPPEPGGGVEVWNGSTWLRGRLKGYVGRAFTPPPPQADRVGVGTTVQFAGYEWLVKSTAGSATVGPGPNLWSTDNVWVDGQGRLHLRVSHSSARNGWECAEVISRKAFGYGRYEWWVDSLVEPIDDNIVVGLFTWDDQSSDANAWQNREIDIEFTRWGQWASGYRATNGSWAIWIGPPTENAKGSERFNENQPEVLPTRHYFDWSEDRVEFVSRSASRPPGANPPARWIYTGAAKPGANGPNVDMNLWLYGTRGGNNAHGVGGVGPANGQPVEIIIRDFKFTPLQPGEWVPAKIWDGAAWKTLA